MVQPHKVTTHTYGLAASEKERGRDRKREKYLTEENYLRGGKTVAFHPTFLGPGNGVRVCACVLLPRSSRREKSFSGQKGKNMHCYLSFYPYFPLPIAASIKEEKDFSFFFLKRKLFSF